MNDYKTDIVFRPAPPKPVEVPTPAGPVQPGAASAPMVIPTPTPATVGPVAPSVPKTEAAPAPQPAVPEPASTPAPAAAPSKSDTNAPKGN